MYGGCKLDLEQQVFYANRERATKSSLNNEANRRSVEKHLIENV